MTNEQLLLAKNIVELLAFIVISVGTVRLHIRSKKVLEGTREVVQVTREIHSMVNGNVGEQKRAYMVLAMQLAEVTRKPEDILSAEKARAAYELHQAQQTGAS